MLGHIMPASARVLGRASDPDFVFATVFTADESDRKTVAAIKQQWRQRRVRGFPQLRATLQADLQQIVEKSGKAIVASCGYRSVLS